MKLHANELLFVNFSQSPRNLRLANSSIPALSPIVSAKGLSFARMLETLARKHLTLQSRPYLTKSTGPRSEVPAEEANADVQSASKGNPILVSAVTKAKSKLVPFRVPPTGCLDVPKDQLEEEQRKDSTLKGCFRKTRKTFHPEKATVAHSFTTTIFCTVNTNSQPARHCNN